VSELVIWSFMVVLTPVALGMAWKLTAGIGKWTGVGLSSAFGVTEPRRIPCRLDIYPPRDPLGMAGRMPRPCAGRTWTFHPREPF
jgi:hypothetical protein